MSSLLQKCTLCTLANHAFESVVTLLQNTTSVYNLVPKSIRLSEISFHYSLILMYLYFLIAFIAYFISLCHAINILHTIIYIIPSVSDTPAKIKMEILDSTSKHNLFSNNSNAFSDWSLINNWFKHPNHSNNFQMLGQLNLPYIHFIHNIPPLPFKFVENSSFIFHYLIFRVCIISVCAVYVHISVIMLDSSLYPHSHTSCFCRCPSNG